MQRKELPKYWVENARCLELILWCAGYIKSGNGVEGGWSKDTHGYWFCDDGMIHLYEV